MNLLKSLKDLLRQLTVSLIYGPVGVLPSGSHFFFSFTSQIERPIHYCPDRN